MTFAIVDSSDWDKDDYRDFIGEYYHYVLQISRMKLTKRQKDYCDKIIKLLSEITGILVYSGPKLSGQNKKQIDSLVHSCNIYAIGLFTEELKK